jgi:hypothetical protein
MLQQHHNTDTLDKGSCCIPASPCSWRMQPLQQDDQVHASRSHVQLYDLPLQTCALVRLTRHQVHQQVQGAGLDGVIVVA